MGVKYTLDIVNTYLYSQPSFKTKKMWLFKKGDLLKEVQFI
jgi:hypothetical protein